MPYGGRCFRPSSLDAMGRRFLRFQSGRIQRPRSVDQHHCHLLKRCLCSAGTNPCSSSSSSSSTDTPTPPSSRPATPLLPACSRLGLDPRRNTRHCPLVYHEDYSFEDWPPNHTFPMDKFERLAHAILTTPQPDIVGDCTVTSSGHSGAASPLVLRQEHLFRPLEYSPVNLPIFKEWLCGPLQEDFVDRFLQGQLSEQEARRIGFREQTCRSELIRRTVLEVAGTLLTAQLACQYGIAANLAGGTHHATHDMGAGYTILNDLVVAGHSLTNTATGEKVSQDDDDDDKEHPRAATTVTVTRPPLQKIDRVLVVDCDVHQGDGTARCMREVPSLEGKLFTLSLHCASNYPHPKAYSTYDVGLPDKMLDEAYLGTLQESVELAIREVNPDLVLYDAGVDIYRHDKLGRLHISEQGIRQRDRFVLKTCVERGIPVAAVIGGGYDIDVDALARRHAIVHEECSRLWREHQMWTQP